MKYDASYLEGRHTRAHTQSKTELRTSFCKGHVFFLHKTLHVFTDMLSIN